jgi:pyrroloquinoline quinone biosynthesis protein B
MRSFLPKPQKPESRTPPTSTTSEVTAQVLGSGQDGGIPQVACRKAHCTAAAQDHSLRRRSPGLALLHHGEKIPFLLDVGPDFPEQLNDLPAEWVNVRNPVAGIFLTHAHIGHYTGLIHLGREVLGCDRVPVYCSAKMASFLRTNGPWSLLVKLKNIELVEIGPGQKITVADRLAVEPVLVPHRAEFTDTYAFIAHGPNRKLLYLPDIDRWEDLEPPIEEIITRVDIALLDGTFYSADELPGRDLSKIPHPFITRTMYRLSKQARTTDKQIIFIHLNHSNLVLDADGKRLADLRNRGFDIAYDGMSFDL